MSTKPFGSSKGWMLKQRLKVNCTKINQLVAAFNRSVFRFILWLFFFQRLVHTWQNCKGIAQVVFLHLQEPGSFTRTFLQHFIFLFGTTQTAELWDRNYTPESTGRKEAASFFFYHVLSGSVKLRATCAPVGRGGWVKPQHGIIFLRLPCTFEEELLIKTSSD